MTSRQIARFAAIRKANAARKVPTDAPKPSRRRFARAKVAVDDGLLAACVAAGGFEEHRAAA